MKASSWNSPNDNGNGDMRWIISTRSTLKIASTFQCNRRRRLLDSSFLLLLLGSAVVLLLPTSAAGTVAQSSVTSSDPLKDGFLSGQSSSTIDEEDGTIDFDLVYVPATSRRARTTTNEEDDDALIYTSRSSTRETDDDSDVASSDETHQRSSNDDKENKDRDTDTDTDANENKNKDDSIIFEHFVAHNDSMTCSSDEHARPFNNQIRGVNLGGWMVLEPWITPSLFYQFLGKNGANETAFDMYTFCTVLGATEANRQLRRHWSTWVTEEIIQQLADSGAVNSVRLPVGDFQFVPYGPYEQCVDGGLAFVDQLLDWCYSRGISVLLDVHTARDSQNGFDNSGQALGLQWTSALSSEFAGLTTFEHWPIRTANWVGEFDGTTATYRSINYENIDHSLKVIRRMVHMYAHHPAILGIEPLNEPWQYTPIDVLQRFYWDGYLIVKRRAPYWKFIMHDSFRFDTNIWGGFMDGCPERALDTHMYQAWRDPDSRVGFYTDACRQKASIASMENAFGPVIVGEWSLATDNCAMWLNGFNDNLPGFPRLPCKYTPCADPYMGTDQPGTPVDPAKPIQGPYGTGMSGPIFGLCPGSRDWIKESSGNPYTGKDWIRAPPLAPRHLDDTDAVMTQLALKKIEAFSGIGHGFFFWNFRTDLYEPQWSYMAALERGWIPKGNLRDAKLYEACRREDDGEYKCIVKRGQLDRNLIVALQYVFNADNSIDTQSAQDTLQLTGTDLENAARTVISDYFDAHRHEGVTCDFGGIAMLVEANRTITDDDAYSFMDDSYTVVKKGPKLWILIAAGAVIALVAGLCGFVAAMRFNPGFNQRVRSSALFVPITRSNNNFLRSSLALPALGQDYEELIKTEENHRGPLSF